MHPKCTWVPPTFPPCTLSTVNSQPCLLGGGSAAFNLQAVGLFRHTSSGVSARVLSCYGAVQSLSGDAERDVAVEAVGQGDCSLYSEDTVTDEEGRFRLRGLLVRAPHFRENN